MIDATGSEGDCSRTALSIKDEEYLNTETKFAIASANYTHFRHDHAQDLSSITTNEIYSRKLCNNKNVKLSSTSDINK